jgi:glycosyltransferase involved in cell wall biosynthesis
MISRGEVFGLVYLEAMSRGCITIAGKGEGMEGIIEHGINGFLCEPGNANELASLIKHINTLSAEEKKTISDRARAKATELSDYNVAKNYIENVLNS